MSAGSAPRERIARSHWTSDGPSCRQAACLANWNREAAPVGDVAHRSGILPGVTDPSPIISPEALFAGLARPDLRLVDVRWVLGSPGVGRVVFEAGHIPGAIHLDMDTDLMAAEGPEIGRAHV